MQKGRGGDTERAGVMGKNCKWGVGRDRLKNTEQSKYERQSSSLGKREKSQKE